MGWEDLLKKVMDVATDEKAQQAMSGGGLIGLAAYNKMKQKQDELSQRPKPGPDCLPTCMVDDERCVECVREQKEAKALLERLKQVEDAIENPEYLAELQVEKPEKCKLCSAPYEVGEQECPYCGTKYDVIWTGDFENVPKGKGEQKQYVQKLAEEAYAAYLVFYKRSSSYATEANPLGLPSALMGLAAKLNQMTEDKLEMTGQDIAEMAKHYEMSYSEYLEGIKTGATVSKSVYKMQELNKKLEKERLEREAANREKNAQFMADQERRRAQNNAAFQHQMNSFGAGSVRNYGYNGGGGGGSGYYCGNCQYYIPGEKRCGNGKRTDSASDYCTSFSRK